MKFDGDKNLHQMEEVEEGGYYAVLLSKKGKGAYKIVANYADGTSYEYYDAYQFTPNIPVAQLKKFNAGINYEVYKYLGAHPANLQQETVVWVWKKQRCLRMRSTQRDEQEKNAVRRK